MENPRQYVLMNEKPIKCSKDPEVDELLNKILLQGKEQPLHACDFSDNDDNIVDIHAGMRNNPRYHSMWGTN